MYVREGKPAIDAKESLNPLKGKLKRGGKEATAIPNNHRNQKNFIYSYVSSLVQHLKIEEYHYTRPSYIKTPDSSHVILSPPPSAIVAPYIPQNYRFFWLEDPTHYYLPVFTYGTDGERPIRTCSGISNFSKSFRTREMMERNPKKPVEIKEHVMFQKKYGWETGAYEISIFHALARREKNSRRISNFKLIVNQYCEVHYLLINLYRLSG
ncbi:unnamed protein product [Rhizophagus irregularis]|nr:unnamed protein product [Rhizophagus irregularis]